MTTTQFFSDANPETSTVDGEVGGLASGGADTWANVRGGSGNYSVDNFNLVGALIAAATNPNTNKWSEIRRFIALFDTSSLGSDTIVSATLNIFVTAKQSGFSQSLDIVASTPASNTALVNADYTQLGTTLLGTILVSDLTNNQYNAIPLNGTGLAAINASGITKLGIRTSGDRTDTEPTWTSGFTGGAFFRPADNGSNQPYLEVVHTGPPETLAAEGRSGASGSSRTVFLANAQTRTLSRSAEQSKTATGAAADNRGRSVENTGGVLALSTATVQLAARSIDATRTASPNVTLALPRGYSRDYASTGMATFSRAFALGLDKTAARSAGQEQAAADLNSVVISTAYSGGDPTVIVDGALEAIGYPRVASSSGAFGVLMTPLVARGGSRSTSRSAISAAKSTAGRVGLSANRARASGNNRAISQSEAGDFATTRSRGKIASQAPIVGSDFRTSEAAAVDRVTARVAARSATARQSGGVTRLLVTAIGLAESTHHDSTTFKVIVSTPALSIAPERDGATITVSTTAINGRSAVATRGRGAAISVCFVFGSSVSESWSKAGFYNVVDVVAGRPFTVSRDAVGTRSAVFAGGSSSTPATSSGAPIVLAQTIGLSIDAQRDLASPPLSFAAVVVQDRVAVESSGRMIGTVALHASDAARDSSTLSTVNALPATLVGEPRMVIIN